MTRRTLLALLISLSTFFGGAAYAISGAKEIAQEFSEAKRLMIYTEVEKRKILGSLYGIQKRMKRISQKKGGLTNELFQAKADVKKTAHIIAGLELQIQAQKERLNKRLRSLYKLSGQTYLATMFSNVTPGDFDHSMKLLRVVMDKDFLLMRNFERNVARHKEHRRKLNAEVQKLVALEKSIKQQEALLEQEHKAKVKMVSTLDANKLSNLTQIQKLRKKTKQLDEDDLDNQILSLLRPSFFEKKGQLPQPVAGRVVQDFGISKDEKHNLQLSHKGWHYGTPVKTAVVAVFGGSVIFSDWLNGYGQTVILDHGDHYYTIYSHLASLRVSTGDEVKQLQTIAEVGNTSRRLGTGLYFEIRHFSEPEDPAHWLLDKGVKISSLTTGEAGTEK